MDTIGPLGQAMPTMDYESMGRLGQARATMEYGYYGSIGTVGQARSIIFGQDRPNMHTMGPLEQAGPTIDLHWHWTG